MIGGGFHLHGLYYFSPGSRVSKRFQVVFTIFNEHLLWHHRPTHPLTSIFSKITVVLPTWTIDYDICHFSKSFRLPFNSSLSTTTQTFKIIHSNVWRPFFTSLDGFKYFVTFIYDFSRVIWIYLLKSTSNVFGYFKDFYMLVTTEFLAHIKILWSENDIEYMYHDMTNYLISNVILHQTSCVSTPQ
jgi:hypothetical protein